MANRSSSSILQRAALAASVPIRRPKHYILTGMAIILAASTVIIVTFIILSPSRLNFSITGFNATNGMMKGTPGLSYKFNVTVDNPSRRAGVKYMDVLVNLQLGRRRVARRSVPAMRVDQSKQLYQPPNSSISMPVEGFVETDLSEQYYNYSNPSAINKSHNTKSTVLVTALVRFKVGLAYTRLYDIRLSCSSGINFFSENGYSAPNHSPCYAS